ncbi:hypothetical protein ACFW9N_45555 [Streptomyces sp. NPDC059496]|uniref:TRADD-N-associated membrane domain-containing protein n=1 Tax=Streptomyces sp. NPDC059496 TaxID=3346851 RepID=UPI0036ABD799
MTEIKPAPHRYRDDFEARAAAETQAALQRDLAELQYRRKTQAVIAAGAITLAALIVLAPGYVSTTSKNSSLPDWALPVITISGLILMGAAVTATILRDQRKAAAQRKDAQRLDSAADDLRERMELASLVNFNRILLDQYHGIATKQANKSFYSSVGAMILGLAVLVVAFFASMQFNALGERVFIGSLTLLSTVFVGYIGKTFMAVYDRSLQQLNQYFNQPVMNQYFLSAERIVDRLDDETKNELLAEIVRDVLATAKQMHSGTTAAPIAHRRRKVPAQPQAPAPQQSPNTRQPGTQ